MKKVAIIGAGAAGCFCSIELKRRLPDTEVDVLEALHKPLAKVAITGGGRCNLTNSFEGVRTIEEAYPRGGRLMKRLFRRFDHKDTWEWFEKEGVKLVLQEDNCVFPASQDAMEIVDLLLRRMRQEGVVLRTSSRVESITRSGGGYSICVKDKGSYDYDAVVVTTGGGTGEKGIRMLETLDIEHIPEVPSLFTFNISDRGLKELMGTVVEKARVSLAGTKFTA
ncbi:MAG: aminoacetone oxidase family FAD-binding enzyme, partial [Bacteroidales bacterium]|nr:aminoacetone oxidase family FAD-binding enzyme [Bacteroidales bacterium]